MKEERKLMEKCTNELENKMETLKSLNKFLKQMDKKISSKLLYIITHSSKVKEDFAKQKAEFILKVSNEGEFYLKLTFNVNTGNIDFMDIPLAIDVNQNETNLKTSVFVYKNNYPDVIMHDLSLKTIDTIINALSKDNNQEVIILLTNGKVSASIRFGEYFFIKGAIV